VRKHRPLIEREDEATGEMKVILSWWGIFNFFGVVFLRALKMITIPLIASSIITGVCGVGSSGLGRMGGKTLLFYLTTTLAAILVGLILVNIIRPGVDADGPVLSKLGLEPLPDNVAAAISDKDAGDIINTFIEMIPENPIQVIAEGQILPIIFFCLLFGYFITRLPEPFKSSLNTFWQAVFELMMLMTGLVIAFAPIGIFGIMARTVADTGFDAVVPLAAYFFTVLAGLAIHFFVSLPLLMKTLTGLNPWRHYRAMAPALLTAFSTSSSSATLPLTMECCEKNAGVSNRVTSFVLPLGATVNMDGTALYQCVAVLFIAQAYGQDLGVGQQLIVVMTALLASIGAAGIPMAGLVLITIILTAVGLPVEAVGLILAVDRLLDMARTAVNVFGDSCGTVIIAKTEGEEGLLEGSLNRVG
jgi:Na+/H+-dicarboxylate symporter